MLTATASKSSAPAMRPPWTSWTSTRSEFPEDPQGRSSIWKRQPQRKVKRQERKADDEDEEDEEEPPVASSSGQGPIIEVAGMPSW